jgi:hypothetical protein
VKGIEATAPGARPLLGCGGILTHAMPGEPRSPDLVERARLLIDAFSHRDLDALMRVLLPRGSLGRVEGISREVKLSPGVV